MKKYGLVGFMVTFLALGVRAQGVERCQSTQEELSYELLALCSFESVKVIWAQVAAQIVKEESSDSGVEEDNDQSKRARICHKLGSLHLAVLEFANYSTRLEDCSAESLVQSSGRLSAYCGYHQSEPPVSSLDERIGGKLDLNGNNANSTRANFMASVRTFSSLRELDRYCHKISQ